MIRLDKRIEMIKREESRAQGEECFRGQSRKPIEEIFKKEPIVTQLAESSSN